MSTYFELYEHIINTYSHNHIMGEDETDYFLRILQEQYNLPIKKLDSNYNNITT